MSGRNCRAFPVCQESGILSVVSTGTASKLTLVIRTPRRKLERVLDYLQDEDECAQNPVRFAPLRREGLGCPQETGAPKATVEVATSENFEPLGTLAKVRLGLTSEVGRVCVSCD